MQNLWSSLPGIYAEWIFPGLVIVLVVWAILKGRRSKPQSVGDWIARVHGKYKI